jgi:hypothetical protein
MPSDLIGMTADADAYFPRVTSFPRVLAGLLTAGAVASE